ncbi:MAG: hypothetical protein HN580_03830 [Deltaproteobacteria bacterium]|jgi:hypothetical protein|nr:hypothetical protein [Deltaproteobacteria bacterium]MBT4268860.1 hypothetical protein [Deltaproteobacteria bacterium]MBT4641834.1 hypothetical protein [Deltaproteobacteria bacterium]MBT6504575.1 hypothetical protein [Deltaproteobacteria bacterium]MBT6612189.1 hypothetical protein [Deltaproteobacteria bacterium]
MKLIRTLLCLFALILSLNSTLYAQSFRIRAREHFDTVWINYKQLDMKTSHPGIGPNINMWMEDPYNYSIGLSYSHLFINNDTDPQIVGIGSDMELIKWGIEYKNYFFKGNGGLFSRLGLSTNTLKTKGLFSDLGGFGGYLGIGWEIKFQRIGLAFEAAGRKINFESDIEVTTYSPSIGVHFYGYI